MPNNDVVIPVVFPDYLIHVDTPAVNIPLPNVPYFDTPSRITIPGTSQRVPYLGHAGVAFFDGTRGTTKYFEYGRYPPAGALGLTRRVSMPDVSISGSGAPTRTTLTALLRTISNSSGQRGRVVGAYIQLPPGAFSLMLTYANARVAENSNSRRTPYDLFTHSCNHFMQQVAVAGGASMPPVIPPQPAGYIQVVRLMHPTLDYAGGVVTVPSIGYAGGSPT